MVNCSLDALKKSSKKKETYWKRKLVLRQASGRRKKTGKPKIGMMELFALTLSLLAR